MNAAKYRDILDENLFQSALDLRLGRRFTFQQDNDPKHTAKITKECLQNNSVTILDWFSQSPDLNPIDHLWRDLKMAVHHCSPSNLTELERICKEEDPRIQGSKTCCIISKKTHGCTSSKGASTQHRGKGLNTYDHSEVEETLKRIQSQKGVIGTIVVNAEGIPIRTTLDNSTTVQYAGLLHQLSMKARSTVRDIDPQNDLTFLRIRSKKHEIMVAPGTVHGVMLCTGHHFLPLF
ncbi:unnamed protein product [Ranitomeya imitator]|uniref:Roadblock/LAMTOR2 domain-containing protein n=1 Tax=Ranitomeya imitator TaxID=111125 RepID=A0ABN9L9E1_9NEOB|nr:unnamed protein product [Ranitomeya imitator]